MSNGIKYPKGSEWRKWDLHVHTPASAGYSGTYDQLVDQVLNGAADVIGINDYFSIEGYKEVKKQIPEDSGKIVLPVVEMRMNNVLANRQSENSGVRINFHIIFNPYDEVEKKDLVSSIESFIKAIKYKKISGQDDLISNIYNDKNALLNDVTVDYDDVLDALEKLDDLSGNYLVWLPYDEYGGVAGVQSKDFPFKPALINRAHIIGSSNDSEINYFLGEGKDYFKYFEKAMPCIKGSDSHSYDYPLGKLKDAGSNPINKYCWIKADPTFDGLKLIVREPEDRVFIGEVPEKIGLITKNKTKNIQTITIKKDSESTHKDIWFDNNVEINSGLVAIIGSKGKGKSALAEVIALLGNSKNYDYFSFLNNDKFKKNKLASNFEATIKWLDNSGYTMNLMDVPDSLKVERVKCIPQNYLEILCNNLGRQFQDEIDSVVFSHIDDAERIERTNLKDLIDYKTQIIDNKIKKKQDSLIDINDKIISLEDHLNPEYSKQVKEKLDLIVEEIKSHLGIKPPKVLPPTSDKGVEEKQGALYAELTNLNNEVKEIEETIESKKREHLQINEKIEKLNIIKGKIEEFEAGYKDLEEEIKVDLNDLLGIKVSEIVKININLKKVDDKLSELRLMKGKLSNLLNADYKVSEDQAQVATDDNLYKKIHEKQQLRKNIQNQVDEPSKKHQKYLEDLSEWKKLFHIKNAVRKGLKKELKHIALEIPVHLEQNEKERDALIKELFQLLEQKVKVYETLYEPVIDFIQLEHTKNVHMELNFSAEIMLSSDFVEKFLSFIDRSRKGSFQGIKESQILLREIIQKYNFSVPTEIIGFINELIGKLRKESIADKQVTRRIEDQLVQGKDTSALYDYLYLLKFIKIDYRLRWGDKLLEDLSPGERGTVLLIFYLLIDKSDVPLVIDQPEENLDNESVYYLLVRYIKKAKKRRQIFIVTHNPNLAVVCDAEQIIYCDLNKKDKYRVFFETGSIENHLIKQKIINVLEGTKPAFSNRQDKYEL